MFAVMKHDKHGLRSVHSKADIDYLSARGWKDASPQPAANDAKDCPPSSKRRGRPPKGK